MIERPSELFVISTVILLGFCPVCTVHQPFGLGHLHHLAWCRICITTRLNLRRAGDGAVLLCHNLLTLDVAV